MDGNNTNPLYTDSQQQVQNNLSTNKSVIQLSDPIQLDIPDEDVIKITRDRRNASKKFFESRYDLTARRQKNERYLFGRQINELEKLGKLKEYETRANDNVLYEIESSLKPLAMSKLPDIMVTPGTYDPEEIQSAKDITVVVNDTNKQREQQELLGIAFKHLPVYFTAIIKARWNSEKGLDGDAEFLNIRPEYVIVDHTCTTKNAEDMGFISQYLPMSVQEVVMKFPSKKEEFYEELNRMGVMVGSTPSWKDMASEIGIWETHFDWYKKKASTDSSTLINKEEMVNASLLEPGVKWEKVSGVMWEYGDVLLDKMLDPNFDHKGQKKQYIYGVPGDESTKQEADPQQLMLGMLLGQPMPELVEETIYQNYFQKPHKPYYFFGYDQWGKTYLDETSRIEQNIRNQENLDDQNKNILDQIKTRVKHIWSKESGLTKSDIQRMDMDDPKIDALINGNVNDVHKAIEPERPDSAQFNALSDTRARMYAISGSNAIRGNIQSDVATSNQIAREGDFTRNDDLVQDTINAACEWMAQWQMQFIKLRYTNEHMKQILGPKGEMTYIRLRRDSISDGMEVMIKASSTDKLKAQRNAMDTAKLGPPYTNPLDFFKDMDMADPEGRTERGMMLAIDPNGYYTKYILSLQNPTAQAGALDAQMAAANGAQQPGMPAAAPNPSVPGQPSPQPSPAGPSSPQNPSPTDTTNIATEQPSFPQGSPRGL